jgi:hypothetical protein
MIVNHVGRRRIMQFAGLCFAITLYLFLKEEKTYRDVFGATICSYSTLLLANTSHFDPQPDPAPSISRKRCRVT